MPDWIDSTGRSPSINVASLTKRDSSAGLVLRITKKASKAMPDWFDSTGRDGSIDVKEMK